MIDSKLRQLKTWVRWSLHSGITIRFSYTEIFHNGHKCSLDVVTRVLMCEGKRNEELKTWANNKHCVCVSPQWQISFLLQLLGVWMLPR